MSAPVRAPRAYRALLHLLPPGFRREFGAELEAVLVGRLKSAAGQSEHLWIWTITVLDILRSAPPEWARALRSTRPAPTRAKRDAMDELKQDLAFALRSLVRSPGFTVVALLTLALGIGANSAIFSVVNAVLVAPLPYEDPDRLVRVKAGWEGVYGNWLSQPEIVDIEEGVQAFDGIGAWQETAANLTGDGEPERLRAASVMPEVFEVLGAATSLGRVFSPEEGRAGSDGVVLLSHALFERRYAGDPTLLGRSIEVSGRSRTVVGVLAPGFGLLGDFRGGPTELFFPLVVNRDNLQARSNHSSHTVARLAEGSNLEEARSQLAGLAARLTEAGEYHPQAAFGFDAVPARADIAGNVARPLFVLLGAVGFVLLIACANVANLLMVRGEERQREMAVRTALGADRSRVVRQLITESLALALAGGVLGVALAALGTRLLMAIDPAALPRATSVTLDGPVLLATFAVTLLTGLLFGVGPALQATRQEPTGGLREGSRTATATRRRRRIRRVLAVSELAFAVVLVIGAGLMLRTFRSLQAVDVGFDGEGVLALTLSLPVASYPDPENVVGFYRQLVDEVRAAPAVRGAAAVRVLPLTSTMGDWSIQVEGRETQPGENPKGDWQAVTPGYFELMGLRLVEGRFFEATDDERGVPVAVVNRTMAREYWPEGALGRRFRAGDARPWVTVVGVVEDVSRNALVDPPRTEMYHPHTQYPEAMGNTPRTMTLLVGGGDDPHALFAPVREVVRRMDPALPLSDVRTVDEVLSAAVSRERFMTTLLAVFGALAVTLAMVGIYGLQAYTVSRRTHEIGIRMALGAGHGRVLGLVLGESARLVAVGLVVGTGLALVLTRLMGALLYGVGATDPLTFLVVPLLLGASALVATWIPALRASGVPPSEALRTE